MDKNASIVSIGGWNSHIFTPQWVAANVFNVSEGSSMELKLDEKQMNLSYKSGDIEFSATEIGVEFKTQKVTVENCHKLEKYYQHLVELLPYTPIRAFGYNYNLVFPIEDFQKTKLAQFVERKDIGAGYNTSSFSFTVSKDKSLRSVNVNFQDNKAEVVCNFQYYQINDIPETSVFDSMKEELKLILGHDTDF